MRDRHLPRLCRSCHGPMACQEDACWRCGAPWAAEERSDTTLRLAVPTLLKVTDRRVVATTASGGRR